jgi:hypothetical protein
VGQGAIQIHRRETHVEWGLNREGESVLKRIVFESILSERRVVKIIATFGVRL